MLLMTFFKAHLCRGRPASAPAARAAPAPPPSPAAAAVAAWCGGVALAARRAGVLAFRCWLTRSLRRKALVT